jgi:hypothetical protein
MSTDRYPNWSNISKSGFSTSGEPAGGIAMTRRVKGPDIGRGNISKVETRREWLKKPAPPPPPKVAFLKIHQASRKRQSGGKARGR